ncbi:putative inorganic phosphate cotransporter [Anticarsia gemmatalis]|uniref:putative inorganic phosphate cotransporter n=1 Tax=Anticarsia gemmatalis TaxID=129554 RepID=UPI003F76B345
MNENEKLPPYVYDKVPCDEIIPEKIDSLPKYGYGVRHVQLVIFLLSLTVNIIARAHMGVTIVAMMSHPKENTVILNTTVPLIHRNDSNIVRSLNVNNTGSVLDVLSRSQSIDKAALINTTEKRHKTYTWPKSVQEMVLNAFFLGYMIMMFPMGLVCQRYGGKLPLQIALFISAVSSIVSPWLTIWGDWKAVCGCRILQGMAQAGTYPGVQALLAKWVPASERATLSSYVYTGVTVGTVVAFQMSGFLGASSWGWPSTFYTVGVICFACFVILTIFGSATPLHHKNISEEEKNYILGGISKKSTKKQKTPWKAILTSKPYWGTIATHTGSNVSFVFFFNQVPSYIHYILGINVKNSGLLSSLPYVASFFTSLSFGWISDYLTNKNIISAKNARRIFNSLAQCGIAFALVCTSYTSNSAVAVTCLVVAMAMHMGVHCGWMVNHIDMAPNFGGILMATGNTIGNVFVVLTPVVVSHIVTDTGNLIQWRIMFFIIAAISFVTNAIFVLLVSTKVQPWNFTDFNESTIENVEEDLKEEAKEKL